MEPTMFDVQSFRVFNLHLALNILFLPESFISLSGIKILESFNIMMIIIFKIVLNPHSKQSSENRNLKCCSMI